MEQNGEIKQEKMLSDFKKMNKIRCTTMCIING